MNMEQWARVRRKVLVDKQSKRSVMSEEGLHWETLQKMLEHSQPPGYRRSAQPELDLHVVALLLPLLFVVLVGFFHRVYFGHFGDGHLPPAIAVDALVEIGFDIDDRRLG